MLAYLNAGGTVCARAELLQPVLVGQAVSPASS
jgi:hypothetical protein